MFENTEKTDIAALGEFGLIDHISKAFVNQNEQTIQGIGDDASVLNPNNQHVVISTDTLVENVHFDLMYTPLKHLGYKSVVAFISDICAMNVIPSQLMLSIALSSKYTLEAVEEFYTGVQLACEKYQIDLVGGDTSTSPKGLIISGTSIGFCDPKNLVSRSGAKEGDLLCVSGDLGGAYMGLQLLEREKRVFIENPEMQPDLKNHDYIVGRQLKPEARIDVVNILTEMKIKPTSMIDISDGLASETLHLSRASAVAFAIHDDKLPIDQDTFNMAMEFGIDATTAALNGGEDFELLFTVDQKYFDEVNKQPDISVIGYARDLSLKNQLISQHGNAYDLKAQGWKLE